MDQEGRTQEHGMFEYVETNLQLKIKEAELMFKIIPFKILSIILVDHLPIWNYDILE